MGQVINADREAFLIMAAKLKSGEAVVGWNVAHEQSTGVRWPFL